MTSMVLKGNDLASSEIDSLLIKLYPGPRLSNHLSI